MTRSIGITAITLLLLAHMPLSVEADTIDVDLTNWEVWGNLGVALNSSALLDIGPGSAITGVEYLELSFESFAPSWRVEVTLSVNNSMNTLFWDWIPAWEQIGPGVFGPESAAFGGNVGFGDGGPFTVDDGAVFVTAYDSNDDGGPGVRDALITSGTLRIHYTPVPEPAALPWLALGGLTMVRG